jgi:hypothetical protein
MDVQAGDLAKGALAGALGGAAGAFVLERAMGQHKKPASPKDPKVKVASAVVEKVAGDGLDEGQYRVAGRSVHYTTGMVSGALYGVAAELMPRAATLGWGALFGAAVWATLPETILPALGLAPPPWERPAKEQAKNLGHHVLFGMTTETVRRPVRAALGSLTRSRT